MLPLKKRLFRLVLPAALVILAGAGLYSGFSYSKQRTEQQTLANQLAVTRHAAREIEALLSRLSTGLDQLVQVSRYQQGHYVDRNLLELFASNYPPDLLLGVYQQDSEGNILVEYPADLLRNDGFPLQRLDDFDPQYSGPRLLPGFREPAVQLLELIPGLLRETRLSALISLKALQQQVFAEQADSLVFILDNSGLVLLHPDPKLVGAPLDAIVDPADLTGLRDLLIRIAGGEQAAFMLRGSLLGSLDPHPEERDLALAFAPLNAAGGKWRLALATPSNNLAAFDNSQLATMILFALGSGGFAFLLFAPLRQLTGRQRLGVPGQPGQTDPELNQLREQLAAAELRSQQLLDNAGDALFFVDPHNGTILGQNQACETLLGYSGDELALLDLTSLLPGMQNRRYLRLLKRVLKSGYGEASDLQFRTKSGAYFTGSVHARFGFLDDRQVVHGVIRDVTRLKQVEQELRQRNRELTLINQITFKAAESSSLPDVLATVREMVIEAFGADGGGIFLLHHQGHQLELVTHQGIGDEILSELKTLPPGEGLIGRVLGSGRPISSANLKKDQRLWSQAVRQSGWEGLQSVPLGSNERTIGALFVFHLTKHVYSRDEVRLLQTIGQQVGIIIAGANLLEELGWQNRLTRASNRELQASRKQLSENLKRQKEATRALERTEKMKNNFLSLASHELRTPLTYILSGSQLILDELAENISAPQLRILQAVHQGGKRLEEIVNNLLEIARFEAQSIYLGKERIDLEELLQQLAQTFAEPLSENRLTLKIGKPLPQIDQLQGDRNHLTKALQRLVENAIKFTPPGGKILLLAQRLTRHQVVEKKELLQPFHGLFFRQELAPDYLQLTVTDTGIGIDPDEQLLIFDKFYEVGEIHAHFTSQTRFGGKGIGLGLALVKGIIEAHNGLVWVESAGTKDGGSSFHLLLPIPETENERQSVHRPVESDN
jgi:PAS domain S-box-containing protein